MLIFFSGRKSSADVSFRFVDVQNDARLSCQTGIEMPETVSDILMYGRFGDAESFCSLTDGRIILYDISCDLDGPLFNIVLQKTPLNPLFLQCMQRCSYLSIVFRKFIHQSMLFTVVFQIVVDVHPTIAAVGHDPDQLLLMKLAVKIVVSDLVAKQKLLQK